MSRLDSITGRALELAGSVGDSFKNRIPGLTQSLPDRAMQWVQTGAALGALKTGGKVAATVARRNPAIALASVAGAGLAYFLVRRHQKKVAQGAIEGKATRIEASKGAGRTTRPAAKRATRKPAGD